MPELGNPALFTSEGSVSRTIEQFLQEARAAVDAAMYRITNPRLAQALGQARERGVRVRLLVDRNKYEETAVTRRLLAENPVPFYAIYGQRGTGTKMHHKFVVLDGRIVLAGSYNWTVESEEQNYDHLLIITDPKLVLAYQREFGGLWPFRPENSAA
jgi:phosphatidylserine/phosphatidylglycerophosphate/cardiolipin synthase-like enzyme